MHLHFSKAGGTALCGAVTRSGCQTYPENCAVRKHLQDGPWWIPWPPELPRDEWPMNSSWHRHNFGYPPGRANRSCAKRVALASKGRFLAVESPLPYPMCAEFDYSVVFRDPLLRAESQALELVRWAIVQRLNCDLA